MGNFLVVLVKDGVNGICNYAKEVFKKDNDKLSIVAKVICPVQDNNQARFDLNWTTIGSQFSLGYKIKSEAAPSGSGENNEDLENQQGRENQTCDGFLLEALTASSGLDPASVKVQATGKMKDFIWMSGVNWGKFSEEEKKKLKEETEKKKQEEMEA